MLPAKSFRAKLKREQLRLSRPAVQPWYQPRRLALQRRPQPPNTKSSMSFRIGQTSLVLNSITVFSTFGRPPMCLATLAELPEVQRFFLRLLSMKRLKSYIGNGCSPIRAGGLAEE